MLNPGYIGKLTSPQSSGISAKFFGQSTAISAWRTIWNNARTSTQLINLFGDSQETNPGGSGRVYVPRLNYEMYSRFGKVGMFMSITGSYGGGDAMWLSRGSVADGGATGFTSDQLLPGVSTSRRLGATGCMIVNSYKGEEINASALIPAQSYWNPADPVLIDIYGRSRSSSKEAAYEYRIVPSAPNFFTGSVIASGTTAIGLNNADNAIRSQTLGPFTNNNPGVNPYNEFIYRTTGSAGDGNDPDIFFIRFRKQTDTGGIYIHPFSIGGYPVTNFLANHANSGPMAAALPQPQAIFIHYGTNDIYNSVTAANQAANTATLISALRGASFYNNPNLLVVVFVDVARTTGTAPQLAQHALLYSEYVSLAQSDANLLVIDSRSAVEPYGWYTGSSTISSYLSDGVHYTGAGGILLAQVEAQQLALVAGAG